jgi:hypothetical protein
MKNHLKKFKLKNLNTPIVFICFNRPMITKKTFSQIKTIKPKELFLIMDGPRPKNRNDLINCNKVKHIISKINWRCKVHKNFSKVNLGLKKRIVSGLDWVFKKVDRAIILEDDCYPCDSFFFFCEVMLNFYKKNKNIGIITGNNFLNKPTDNKSYYFSKYSHIWGWATWRRTWKVFNDNDQKIANFIKSSKYKKICKIFDEQKYWLDMHNQIKSGLLKSWAYYFLLNMWKNNYLTVTPNLNLVKNLAINSEFCTNPNDSALQIDLTRTVLKFPLVHPKIIKVNKEADNQVFYSIYKKNIQARMKNKIKEITNYIKSVQKKLKN